MKTPFKPRTNVPIFLPEYVFAYLQICIFMQAGARMRSYSHNFTPYAVNYFALGEDKLQICIFYSYANLVMCSYIEFAYVKSLQFVNFSIN